MLEIDLLICLCIVLLVFIICYINSTKKIFNKFKIFKMDYEEKINELERNNNQKAKQVEKKVKNLKLDCDNKWNDIDIETKNIKNKLDEYNTCNEQLCNLINTKHEEYKNKIEAEAEALWDVADENKKEFDEFKENYKLVEKEMTNKFDNLLEIVTRLAKEFVEHKIEVDRYIQIDKAADRLNEEKESAFDVIKRKLAEISEENKTEIVADSKGDVSENLDNTIIIPDNLEDNKAIVNEINTIHQGEKDDCKEIEEKLDLRNHNEIIKVLDKDQRHAYNLIRETNDNIFITGKAGTGKSFLIELFSKGINKKILLLAPTGTAAVNINGVTIHNVFGYKNLEKPIDQMKVNLNSEKKVLLKNVEVIVIDEISMVRADVLDKMDKILQIVNESNKPFGGKQMILFGDLFQLPPIVRQEEKDFIYNQYDSEFFFSANSYRNGGFAFIELKENHRQKGDQIFFDILNRIREGRITKQDLNRLNERLDYDRDDIEFVTKIYARKENVDIINEKELQKLTNKEWVYPAEIQYRNNERSLTSLPIPYELKLKKDALVMFIKNDQSNRWQNGTKGIVISCEPNKITVKLKSGVSYEVEKEKFEEKEAYYEDGIIKYRTILKVEQFPLVLGYAMTIHKSQGATWNQVAVDVSECFAPGQAYVALSRCKSIDGLFLLNQIQEEDIIVNNKIKEFYLEQLKNS